MNENSRNRFDNELVGTLLSIEDSILASCSSDPRIELYKILLCKHYLESTNKKEQISAQYLKNIFIEVKLKWPALNVIQSGFSISDSLIEDSFNQLQKYSFINTNYEVIEYVFEYLSTHSNKGSKGQFFTPRYIIEQIVSKIEIDESSLIADPACGSGGFLVTIANLFNINNKNRLFGFDFDNYSITTAIVLNILKGLNNNYFQVNSLIKPSNLIFKSGSISIEDIAKSNIKNFKGFNIIATNPPFGGVVDDNSIINDYSIINGSKKNERDILFIERCYDLLSDNGQLIIVLPTNKFGDLRYSNQRKWILSHFKVHSILSLHRDSFLPHTHQKTSVLFARKRSKPTNDFKNDKITFVISDKPGKDSKGKLLFRGSSVDSDLHEAMNYIL